MFWFVIRDAAGEILEVTPCAEESSAQLERMQKAIKAWQNRGDQAVQLDHLKYRMTSFDGNVRVLSIEPDSPELS